MAVVLAFIFMAIPLYEISSDAFKANYVYEVEAPMCGLYYIEMYPYTVPQFIQGKMNN